jgi:hypothetical protein
MKELCYPSLLLELLDMNEEIFGKTIFILYKN